MERNRNPLFVVVGATLVVARPTLVVARRNSTWPRSYGTRSIPQLRP